MRQRRFSQFLLLMLLVPGGGLAFANSHREATSNALSALQQTGKITTKGSIVDAKGEPLIGVSILEKGTTMVRLLILMVILLCRYHQMLQLSFLISDIRLRV